MVIIIITLPCHLQVYSHNDVPNPEGTAVLCWFCLLFHPCCLSSSGLSGWMLCCSWTSSSCSLLTAHPSAWLSAISSNSAILSCWGTSVRCWSNFSTSCSSFLAFVSFWPTYPTNTCSYYNSLKACDIGYYYARIVLDVDIWYSQHCMSWFYFPVLLSGHCLWYKDRVVIFHISE